MLWLLCRSAVVQSLCCSGLESTYALYPALSQLLSLLEVEEAGSLLTDRSQRDQVSSFFEEWKKRLPLLNSDFQFVEPVLATRCALLFCLLQNAVTEVKGEVSPPVELCRRVDHLFKALTESLLTRVEVAREAGAYQVCEGALFALKQHIGQLGSYGISKSMHSDLPWTVRLEEAKLCWERGDTVLAMTLLKTLLNKLSMVSCLCIVFSCDAIATCKVCGMNDISIHVCGT